MSVYVDDMYAPFGRMKMCHMMADPSGELLAMADRIGLARKWIQFPDTSREHFDVAMVTRAKAVSAGAIEISWHDLGTWSLARRKCWPKVVTFQQAITAYREGRTPHE